MSLSEIHRPEAKTQPINTFYVYSIDAKSETIDSIVTNSITSTPGSDLKIQPGTVPGNHVIITAPQFAGTGIDPQGVCYLDGGKNLFCNTMVNGELMIGRTGFPPSVSTLTQGPGARIVNGSGTITLSRLPYVSISATSTTALVNGAFTPVEFTVATSVYDPFSFRSGLTDFKVPVGMGGVYFIRGNVRPNDSPAGDRGIRININGAPATPSEAWGAVDTGGRASPVTMSTLTLAAGDVINLAAYESAGGPIGVSYVTLYIECLNIV